MNHDLNVKNKTIKLLGKKKKKDENLCALDLDKDFLDTIPKPGSKKHQIDYLNFITIKNFFS